MKRLPFFFALFLATFAHASISEIDASYPNLTAALPPTPIFTAGSSVGSYLVCVYLEQASSSAPMTATLDWTDDNNLQHNVSLAPKSGQYYSALCQPIRNEANTAPIISTSGTSTTPYGLYVAGFGFWPGGTQKQGGLTMAATYLGWPVGSSTMFTTAKEATYLLAIQTLTPVTGVGAVEIEWQDHYGTQYLLTNNLQEMAVVPIHATADTLITINGTSTRSPDSTTQVALLQFGTPATGSGPLTDYEANLLDWTDATYPTAKTLFTEGSTAEFGIVAANITVQNQGGPAECVNVWSGTTLTAHDVCSDTQDTYGSLLLPMAVAGGAQVNYWTYNATYPYYGKSPSYNAEVDAIVFSGTPAADRHRAIERRDNQRPGR
jgi:hypothetical protein